jgi:hypothetical protein
MSATTTRSSLEDAAFYTSQRAWSMIPVPLREKEPNLPGWQKLRLGMDDLPKHFSGEVNVGRLNGEPSGWHVDADMDVPEAVEAAAELLPPTDLIHGRPSNPRSHYSYRSPGCKTKQYRDPTDGEMLAELRSTGSQTLVPRSQHPSGEKYHWEKRGEAAKVATDVLTCAVARVAAVALLARHWPGVGSRHQAENALCGLLLRAGWEVEETEHYVRLVARLAGDEEWPDRGKGVQGTKAKLDRGEPVTGLPTLVDILTGDGKRVVDKVCTWLSVKQTADRQADEPWDDPIPLPSGLPPVQSFDPALLPDALSEWVCDAAERMQITPDYTAVAALVAAGAIVGRRFAIRPKRHDDWYEVPNLWGSGIGRPGVLKSPALDEGLGPLNRLVAAAYAAHVSELERYQTELAVAEAQRAAAKEKLRSEAKSKHPNEALLRQLAEESRAPLPVEPKPRRYKTEDATTEKLGELLVDNPNGLLVRRDELTGWLRSLDKQGREGDRAFYLEAWNGKGGHEIDRIGRGSLHVPALCLSVLGGIQPGPISRYVYDATQGKENDDGLLQRFQVLVWPDVPATYRLVDRRPNVEARERAYAVYARLDALTAEEVVDAAKMEGGGAAAIPYLRFSQEAQHVFDDWYVAHMRRVRSGTLPPALEAHLSKYAKLMPCLALLFHLIDVADPSTPTPPVADGVSEEAAVRAVTWCEYLQSHLRRLYASAISPEMAAARALLEHITAGDVHDGMSTRDLYRPQWSLLDTPEAVDGALRVLERYGWVRVEQVKPEGGKGGRPSARISVYPEAARAAAAAAGKDTAA